MEGEKTPRNAYVILTLKSEHCSNIWTLLKYVQNRFLLTGKILVKCKMDNVASLTLLLTNRK